MSDEITYKIETFFEQFRVRSYAKGQILLLSGDQPEYVYHLLKGKVKQYDVTYRGNEIILNVFKPPAFFPMSLAINKTINSCIYEAETDIDIRQAPVDETIKFIKDNPDVMFDLLSRVYRGIDDLLGRMTYLMTSSAESRLIYELIIEARRFGTMNDEGGCSITINEIGLGARAGLSRETVSREVTKLKNQGLIKIEGKNIFINNIKALEQKLGQEV